MGNKMKWGKAKFEARLLAEEILGELKQGKNLTEIYESFKTEGKISSSMSTFKRHAKTIRDAYLENEELEFSKRISSRQSKEPSTQNKGTELRKMPDWNAKSNDEEEDNGSW